MPVKIPRLLLVAALVLGIAGAAAAQDPALPETHTFDSGASFSYPEDWTLETDADQRVIIDNDSTTVYVVDYAFFEADGFDATATLPNVLRHYMVNYHASLRFRSDQAEAVDLDGRESARFAFMTPLGNHALVVAVRFSDGTFGVIEAVGSAKELSDEDTALAIAASFDVAGSGEEVILTGAGDCTVSTDTPNTVNLRVGPGENRTSYAFLPANEDFEVLGKANDDDGNLWWKLDRETVAPNKSAAEAWVSADAVEQSGNCAAVVDVNAPPIIPIVAAPPQGTTPGGEGGEAGAEEVLPTSGSWTVTYPPTSPASCVGTQTVNLPLGLEPVRFNLSVASGGSAIFIGSSRLDRLSPGVYQGYAAITGFSVLVTVTVASPTQMSVRFIMTLTDEGPACSVTVTGTATKN